MVIALSARVRTFAALVGAAVLTLICVAPAAAHTELRATTPQEGSTVESVSELRLEFTGDLLEIGTALTLVDAEGAEHELEPRFPSVNVVTGTFEDPLPAGQTQLRWRVVAGDGHPIEGVLSFTMAGPSESDAGEPTPAPTPTGDVTSVPAVPEPEPTSATPVPSASAAPQGDGGTGLPAWLLPLIAGFAAGGALVAVLAAKARRR